MKKVSLIFLILMFISIFNISYGDIFRLEYDGVVHEVEQKPISLYINNQKVSPNINPVILEGRTMVPLTGVFDVLGVKFDWDNSIKEVSFDYSGDSIRIPIDKNYMYINDSKVSLDVPAKLINNYTMVPLRAILEKFNFKVSYDKSSRIVYVSEIEEQVQENETDILDSEVKVTGVEVYESNSSDVVVKINASDKIKSYDKFHLGAELGLYERVAININDTVMGISDSDVIDFSVASNFIENIRYSQKQITPSYVSRVVIDLKSAVDYTIKLSDDGKAILVIFGQSQGANEVVTSVYDLDDLNEFLGDNIVSVLDENTSTNIVINRKKSQSYRVEKLENSNEIVVELETASFTSKLKREVLISDKVVSKITTSISETTGKYTISLKSNATYTVTDNADTIVVKVNKRATSSLVSYKKENNVGKIYIDKVVASNKIRFSEDEKNKKVLVTIPASLVTLSENKIAINDDLLRSIYIEKVEDNYVINVNYVNNITCTANSDNNGNTIISVIAEGKTVSPNSTNYKIVVDAGHGGEEVGAVYEDIMEKDLNLDIALKLQKLLKNAGYTVVMTRTSDEDVSLIKRAEIANKAGADLFVSVHINSYSDTSIYGTETLYYPSDDNNSKLIGKRVAELIQEQMVSILDTSDRGIKSRPNLVVLNSTNMPAVLAEVAFLSNKTDRENLEDVDFRQDAAEAIFNGIVSALNEI